MRTTIATVNLYLRTAKKLADGTYAIYLRCNFHGMYEVVGKQISWESAL